MRLTPASVMRYPKVEAIVIVQALDKDGSRIVIDHAGQSYLVETSAECGDGQPLDGRHAFIVSPGTFAGPGSRLILALGREECRIVDSQPLWGDVR